MPTTLRRSILSVPGHRAAMHEKAASSSRLRSLGFDRKWAIHPAQLDTLNQAFAPPPAERP